MEQKQITILAIETSCDDTGIAIIKAGTKKIPDFKILSNIISSQIEVHKKWGGVYPALAKREHQKNILPALEESLKKSKLLKKITIKLETPACIPLTAGSVVGKKIKKLKEILEREKDLAEKLIKFLEKYQKPNIDLIAVTNGPGLDPCLWVGVNFAKSLSYFWDIPILSVNHIKAHLFVNNIKNPLTKTSFPIIGLIVSGGHTQLVLMTNFGKYKILGETRDDAGGECFDKTAKILGLPYPGGPEIAKIASQIKTKKIKLDIILPRPMINTKDYDFSFSGLKTAVLYDFKKRPLKIRKSKKYIQEMCIEIQQSIIDVLIKKTIKASKNYNAKTIILGGGVTANQELRKQFKQKIKKEIPKTKLLIPDSSLSTDNAVMIAIAGYFRWKNKTKENWQDIKAEPNLRIE
ncbi:MAG: tRNA (adenosine(37)-N6)-threonylcarbamoyltransferase complex transferase subunit TsaD [Candidatus Nealsonbacteria bacterium]